MRRTCSAEVSSARVWEVSRRCLSKLWRIICSLPVRPDWAVILSMTSRGRYEPEESSWAALFFARLDRFTFDGIAS